MQSNEVTSISTEDTALYSTVILSPRLQRFLRNFIKYSFLVILSLPFIFPFWWMLTSSFKPISEILAQPTLLPRTWRFQNFIDIFTYQPYARHYFNSAYIAILVTIGTLAISAMAGYAFARIRFPGNNILFIMLLSAMMMPSEVTIIPNFFLFKALNLTNTHVPLIILPILGGGGVLGIFIMRQFYLELPRELEEAAMLDGLNRWGIFWKIALPLSRPALGAVAILTFLFNWNSFLEPLVFINDLDLFTLPLSLNNFNDPYGLPLWHLQLAATTLSIFPILLVYLIAQKQVVNTMALTGVK
jgi:multiple sugar transport system permease protein